MSVLGQLKTEFTDAQKFLKVIDENIKRLTGRDPTELRPTSRRNHGGGGAEFRTNDRPFPHFEFSGELPSVPRRGRGLFASRGRLRIRKQREEIEEESPDEDLPRKVTVQSSVVATLKAVKTRKDTIETQKGDRRGMERNRRMFGMILGTLQKFQSEESKRKEQAQKRQEIEQKLEQAAEEERESLRKERQELFLARREKQAQIRRLEQKLEIAQMHEEWENRQKLLLHFTLTPASMGYSIAYRPKKHTPESQKKMQESQKKIQEIMEKQKQVIEQQLLEIDELYRKGDMEENYEEMEDDTVAATKSLDKENVGPLQGAEPEVKEDDPMVGVEPMAMEIGIPEHSLSDVIMPPNPAEASEEQTDAPAESKQVDSIGDQEFEPIYD